MFGCKMQTSVSLAIALMHPLWLGAKKDKRWLYSQSKVNKVAVKIKQKKNTKQGGCAF